VYCLKKPDCLIKQWILNHHVIGDMEKGQSLPRKSQNLSVYGSVCVFVSAGDIGEWGDVGV
jgi:hypothetical protein